MSTKSFLGITVEGDTITYRRAVAPQRPLEDLAPLIRTLLGDEMLHSFGWNQYTPYFNDGDPCLFGLGDPWFKTVNDVEPDDDEDEEGRDDFGIRYGHPSLGERKYEWATHVDGHRVKVFQPYAGPNEALYTACVALADAFESEAFDDVLLEAFGDHAEVVVRRDGIRVDFYEHS